MKTLICKRLISTLTAVSLTGGLAASAFSLAEGAYSIDWRVIGAGGGTTTGGPYMLEGTIGQPVAGDGGAEQYDLCVGYLCGDQANGALYIPWITRP